MSTYGILSELSKNTFLAEKDGQKYILKEINEEEIPLFRSLCRVNHTNLARVFEIALQDGRIFAVTEYVEGNPLRPAGNEEEVICLMSQLCDGLTALHSLGIVHRDINPNNIIVEQNGRLVIIDFGIARLHDDNKSADTQVLGTRNYTAPEQFGFLQTDGRADLYSCGMILEYLLKNLTIRSGLHRRRYGKIIARCKQMNPKDRFADAEMLKNAILIAGGRKVKSNMVVKTLVYGVITLIALFCFCGICFDLNETGTELKNTLLAVYLLAIVDAVIFTLYCLFSKSRFLHYTLTKKGKFIFILCLILAVIILIGITIFV